MRAKVQCLHARAAVVASNASVADSRLGGELRAGCSLEWCPDCGAIRPAGDAPWHVPGSGRVKRYVRELQRRLAARRLLAQRRQVSDAN
jgi:hypothetical protein